MRGNAAASIHAIVRRLFTAWWTVPSHASLFSLRPLDLGGRLPFHCAPIFSAWKDEIEASFADVPLSDFRIRVPWYSSYAGGRMREDVTTPNLWYESIAQCAQSMACIRAAVADGIGTFVELNPKSLYCRTAMDCGASFAVAPQPLNEQQHDIVMRCAQCVAQLFAYHGPQVLVAKEARHI